ncbi:MAG: rhodanese-like domain-containing protein [Nitrosomonadales bacterium]|nr:rhodanese-like domain-containing protein [Nitrosomonadales bacterium]
MRSIDVLLYLQNNIWTILIALTSGGMLFWSFFGNRLRGIKEVDHIAALQLINHQNALVLDVREQGEYDAGHVLNSKLIPLGKLSGRIGELEKYREKPIVVVCRSGQRSASACALLGKLGFAQSHNLNGGIIAWQKASLPLEK